MVDDLNNRGAQDRSRISLSEPHEVFYWTEHLGVSAQELQQLVAKVVPGAAAVREALQRR